MKIKNVLISQPKPADFSKTAYKAISDKYKVNFDFEKFVKSEGVNIAELRAAQIHLEDYTAIIMTSKVAIDNFFRIAKEMRYKVNEETKYFCTSESVALYLQNYIQYRKRKIFFGNQTFADLVEIIKKHEEEKFFMPCSNILTEDYDKLMREAGIEYQRFIFYRTLPADLSHIDIKKYDALVFFTPIGIESLRQNFPDFVQENVAIGGSGDETCKAIVDSGFTLNFGSPSMASTITAALESFISSEIKKDKKSRTEAKTKSDNAQ